MLSRLGEDNFKMTDEEAKQKVRTLCGVDAREIEGIDIAERFLVIKKLRENGLSIRQISRITGISKGTIEIPLSYLKDTLYWK